MKKALMNITPPAPMASQITAASRRSHERWRWATARRRMFWRGVRRLPVRGGFRTLEEIRLIRSSIALDRVGAPS
jgi:hypothetical protein